MPGGEQGAAIEAELPVVRHVLGEAPEDAIVDVLGPLQIGEGVAADVVEPRLAADAGGGSIQRRVTSLLPRRSRRRASL